jgi:hypothetical protein
VEIESRKQAEDKDEDEEEKEETMEDLIVCFLQQKS